MNNKGFTLIELLTTMAIIAILSGISLFAMNGARESARNGRRQSDLETIRQALEMYKSDCSIYPSGNGVPPSSITASCAGSSVTYLQSVPTDPISTNQYYYCVSAGGLSYEIFSTLEGSSSTVSSNITGCTYSCGSSVTCRYKVNNP